MSIIYALLAVYLLSACSSVKLGYEFVDEYIKYKISSLFDLDADQKKLAYKKIDSIYIWHQQEELEPLIDLAQYIKTVTADKKIDSAEFDAVYAKIIDGRSRYLRRIASDAVALLATLNQEQVEQYRYNREEAAQEDFEEDWQKNVAERLQERVEDGVDSYENWFGTLDKKQLAFIRASTDASDTRIQLYHSRRKASMEFFYGQLLEHRTDRQYMLALFYRYIDDPEFFYGRQNKILDQMIAKARVTIPEFFSLINDEQLLFFHSEIDDLVEDLESLKPAKPELI